MKSLTISIIAICLTLTIGSRVTSAAENSYVSVALVPEGAREVVKELRNIDDRIANLESQVDHLSSSYAQLLDNTPRNELKGAIERHNRLKAETQASLDKLRAEKEAIFTGGATVKKDILMQKVSRLKDLEAMKEFAQEDHKRFTRTAELKQARADVDKAAKEFLKTRKGLVVKGRGKLGLIGGAVAVGAMAAEAVNGNGAEASELRAADVPNNAEAGERSDVSIKELDSE